ncbi:MAG: sterol carrier family protein [Candidatus Ancillula sp.]|nr:sterol carrier family protein [Candidatus Ancillula sp.]
MKAEVIATLNTLKRLAPGNSVELRIVPFAAISCIEGVNHRRGTPPNVVEMSGETWLKLVRNEMQYDTALDGGLIDESGTRAHEVAKHLPFSAKDIRDSLGDVVWAAVDD